MCLVKALVGTLAVVIALAGCGGENGAGGAGGSGASTGAGGGDPPSLSEVLGILVDEAYVLVGAQAHVVAGGRNYRFQLQWEDGNSPTDPGFLVGGCAIIGSVDGWTVSADLAETWPRESGDRFSFWTPDSFEAGSIIEPGVASGASAQMGVFDHANGEEWSVVPPGRSGLGCSISSLSRDIVTCNIGWFGVMSENAEPDRKSFGAMNLTCIFAPRDADYTECLRNGCNDNNPCTFDHCSSTVGRCTHQRIGVEDYIRSADEGWEFVAQDAAQCVTGEGFLGLCVDGECEDYPCSEDCGDEVTYNPETNRCFYRRCSTEPPPTCVGRIVTNCSAGF